MEPIECVEENNYVEWRHQWKTDSDSKKTRMNNVAFRGSATRNPGILEFRMRKKS